MLKHPRTVRMDESHDANRAVEEVAADGTPRVLVRDGVEVAVVLSPRDYAELRGEPAVVVTPDHDPEKLRAALRDAVGILDGVDIEAFKRELREARGQDSRGRPGD